MGRAKDPQTVILQQKAEINTLTRRVKDLESQLKKQGKKIGKRDD